MTLSAGNPVRNRIEKNLKKLKAWADRNRIEAYRVYDRDIPDYPFIVDLYKNQVVIYDRRDEHLDSAEKKMDHLPRLLEACRDLFKVGDSDLVLKRRQRQKGDSQYERLSETGRTFVIRESQALFEINLHDYLDTGLFLDHRLMRQLIFKAAKGKNFLNLFSYTGSVSVFAALGGALTTSVDMSATYTRWAERNFNLNQIPIGPHRFITQNALEYLEKYRGSKAFDLIFLDPPTFSNSKRMEEAFEVEKDQEPIVDASMSLLKSGGVLYFSNNKRSFKLSPALSERYDVQDITEKTLPMDFRDPKIHHVFEIRARS